MKLPKVSRPRKARIHTALREQVWLRQYGPAFDAKCYVCWCNNQINVFNFQCGHMLAESRGGSTTLDNLVPICSRCNQSMGTMHMDEWQKKGGATAPEPRRSWFRRLFQCWK